MSAITALNQALQQQQAISKIPQPKVEAPAKAAVAAPRVPNSLEETGLTGALVEQLALKLLYFRGEMLGRELAQAMGLKFSIIEETVETFKRQHVIAVKRSMGMGNASGLLTLTESGRSLAREFMENNAYAGPAPVPLDQYAEMVRLQRPKKDWLSQELLRKAFGNLVVNPHVMAQIGPAANANKSFLIYGQPGNGKTALAESLNNIESEPIFVPYAIEYHGNIVQMFDPIYHIKMEEESSVTAIAAEMPYDGRFFRCRRPFIITGGELTLEMLDLSFNKSTKVYDAPFQLKANNGIYLIDDFGRQKASPAEVLNRWIVPMERHVDYLSFQSGGKITVPFEAFLIFSTNLRPHQLGDEAFLRRIQYKMFLRSPDRAEFAEIFARFCRGRQISYPDGLLDRFIDRFYTPKNRPFRRCHPRDVVSHAIDIIHFEKRPLVLDDDVMARAYASCFVEDDPHAE